MHIFFILFVLQLFYAHGAAQAPAGKMHDIHISNTEMEWMHNRIEISTRIFTDDLLNALIKKFKLEDIPDSRDQSIALINAYIGEKFVLKQGEEQIPMQFEELQPGQDAMWCTFSVGLEHIDPDTSFSIANTILFELFRDQTNIMQITRGEKKKVLTFDRKHEQHIVQF